ncbi:hypothetical protein PAJL_836 [Cutibacterium acnes HL042PA3]|nr:hypothetical protein PAJL_836 [Cutibacterium acnes HL042PA3]
MWTFMSPRSLVIIPTPAYLEADEKLNHPINGFSLIPVQ